MVIIHVTGINRRNFTVGWMYCDYFSSHPVPPVGANFILHSTGNEIIDDSSVSVWSI